jgi:hypothetical protein
MGRPRIALWAHRHMPKQKLSNQIKLRAPKYNCNFAPQSCPDCEDAASIERGLKKSARGEGFAGGNASNLG